MSSGADFITNLYAERSSLDKKVRADCSIGNSTRGDILESPQAKAVSNRQLYYDFAKQPFISILCKQSANVMRLVA